MNLHTYGLGRITVDVIPGLRNIQLKVFLFNLHWQFIENVYYSFNAVMDF